MSGLPFRPSSRSTANSTGEKLTLTFRNTHVPEVTVSELDYVRSADRSVNLIVTIGSQVWMSSNLKTGQFANGEQIQVVKSAYDWKWHTGPAMCNYDNDESYGLMFGGLYNWAAVTDRRGLCPPGWHVPTDEDWMTLEEHLGMPQNEIAAEGYIPATLRGSDANVGGKLAMHSWLWNQGKGCKHPLK